MYFPRKLEFSPNIFGFFPSLLDSNSIEVQVTARLSARDKRKTLGSNLDVLKCLTDIDPWSSNKSLIRQRIIEAERSRTNEFDRDAWRVTYLSKLLEERTVAHHSNNREKEQYVQSLIDSLVVN